MSAASGATPTRELVGFELPPDREAGAPPEERGLDRDGVRLLVAGSGRIHHTRFRALPTFLRAGDLLVVNTSAAVPSALDAARGDGRDVVVHVSRPLEDGAWVVELRRPDGSGPELDGEPGEQIHLPAGVILKLQEPYLRASSDETRATAPTPENAPTGVRLWRAVPRLEGPLDRYLSRYGRPITYRYLRTAPGPDAYRTVFGRVPGSAEMASAGRPFTDAMITELVTRGVTVAPVLLHTGVSSPEADEPPAPEPFEVPPTTAALVEHTRARGGRVVAVGTTVTRALESAARRDGRVVAARGDTSLVLGPDRPARVVDGLVTGWHAPGASHLRLLEAVAGADLVRRAYAAALEGGYLWHEFGDSCLLLPDRGVRPRGGVRSARAWRSGRGSPVRR